MTTLRGPMTALSFRKHPQFVTNEDRRRRYDRFKPMCLHNGFSFKSYGERYAAEQSPCEVINYENRRGV